MARPKRSFRPDTVYHLIPRIVAGDWLIRGDEEREEYLRLLGSGLQSSDWQCLTYAIMSNHVHLGLVAGKSSLRSWLRDVHNEFANWINLRNKRIGAVFVKGPKSYEVLPSGVARLIGYIHRNPVRAGLVEDPSESTWTSHRAYAELAPRPPWLATEHGLERAGFHDASQMHRWIRATAIDRYDMQEALANRPRIGAPPKARPASVAASEIGRLFAGYRAPRA